MICAVIFSPGINSSIPSNRYTIVLPDLVVVDEAQTCNFFVTSSSHFYQISINVMIKKSRKIYIFCSAGSLLDPRLHEQPPTKIRFVD
jgi:hypothetical protein